MIDLEYLRTNEIKTGYNAEVVNFIEQLYKSTSDIYLKQHKDWYLNDRFVRGDHWITYNKTTNKIQNIPIQRGEVRRTVNKIRSQMRGVKNFIKRSQPRWEIHPNEATDEAYDEAQKKNKILQNIYRKSGLKQLMTDVIINGLKYSVGVLEGEVTERNGKNEFTFWVDSTYDILPDPYASNIKNCRYIIKTTVKPVESVKNNKNYKIETTENIADNREAASEYKNILEREKYNKELSKGTSALESTIVKELWLYWEKDGSPMVKVITVCGNNVARVHSPKYRRYPFFAYNPERNEESIFSQPWIKDLISLNKSIDKTVSKIESYIDRMLSGKYLIKKGVEVSMITDSGAEKIYYKGNVPPKQLNLEPLPSTPFSFVGDVERWLEELGGVRDASLGRSSGSLQSGKGIEALQSADAGTVAEPIENLEILLSEVGQFILDVIADYNITSDSVIEDGEEIKFIGKAPGDVNLEDTIVIKGNDEVKVEIVPEISYSEEAKKEIMLRLAESELIDPQTLLEQFKFSNIADIIERVEKRKEEEYKKEMLKQRESHRTDGNGPEDTADLADQENMQMAAGQKPPLTPKALWGPEHTQLHMAFLNENMDAYQQNKQLFDEHINNEEQYK